MRPADHPRRSRPAAADRPANRPATRLATACTAAALAAVTLLAGCASSAARTAPPVPTVPAPLGPNTPVTVTTLAEPDPAPAPSAEEAVRRYVTAEADGDWATSYALLAEDDRRRAGSLAVWVDEADERLPFVALADTGRDGSAVVTTATLAARLDEARVVPGRVRIEWRPVAAGDGWLVSPEATRVEALLPDEAGAAAVAVTWLEGRRRGETAGQYAGNLLGQPTLVVALPDGAFRAGPPTPLDEAPDPQVAVQAFGPEAARFVRAVPVDGPVALVVLTAPNGETWEVVGVQSPR